MHGRWVLVQSWVQETDGLLASLESLVVDTSDDTSPNWSRSGSTTNESWGTHGEDDDVVTNGGNVWVATAGTIVKTVAHLGASVVWVWWVVLGEVGGNGSGLVRCTWVDVGETTTGAEAGDCGLLILVCVASEESGANGSQVWAAVMLFSQGKLGSNTGKKLT